MPLVRRIFVVLLPLAAMTMVACVAPASSAPGSDAPVVATLIVKPQTPTADAEAVIAPMREALGASAGVRYVRPMAGNAHVVHLTAPATRDQVGQLIERLRATQAYEYVERDVPMKKH
jgi:cell division septation protein DedD